MSATEYFRSAVAEHPGSPEAQNILRQALAQQGVCGEAVKHYRTARASYADLSEVHRHLAVAPAGTSRDRSITIRRQYARTRSTRGPE
ncbi:MAG: hypothetical protein KJ749_01955 [Planctomycetes bacterium]|nr:hypothetical protein [Planctomycetota bacterium]